MKTAVVIHEENHGFIGIAADIRSAFDFLLTDHWITEKTEFPIEADDDSDFVPLETLMKRFEFNNLLDTLVFYGKIPNSGLKRCSILIHNSFTKERKIKMFSPTFTLIFNILFYIDTPIFLGFAFSDTAKHWHDADDIPFEDD